MRIFRVRRDEDSPAVGRERPNYEFTAYGPTPFREEKILHDWLEEHQLLEDESILIVGREVRTDLDGWIDLLGVDRQGNVVVVELKKGRTPREVVAQALEYAAWASGLDEDALGRILGSDLAEAHRKRFGLEETVSFNRDQRLVIVAEKISERILRSAEFLVRRGLRVSCVEFALFESGEDDRLASHQVVGDKPAPRSTGKTNEAEFMARCDEHGRAVFTRLLEWARRRSLTFSWGNPGLSVGVGDGKSRVVVCYANPPGGWAQSVYSGFCGHGSLSMKTGAPPEILERLGEEAKATGLFQPAGREWKCLIDRACTDEEIDRLLGWCERVEETIRTYAGA